MIGNVAEIVSDKYTKSISGGTDPEVFSGQDVNHNYNVVKGGYFGSVDEVSLRYSWRNNLYYDDGSKYYGFRLASDK